MSEATTDNGVENEIEVRKLQISGRVDIPEEMHLAMGVDEGDKVFVKWDDEKEVITLMPVDTDFLNK